MNSFRDHIKPCKQIDLQLKINSFYSENDLLILGLTPINNHKMDYLVFEHNDKVYFFEKIEKNLLRLFCCTGKQSFYLS